RAQNSKGPVVGILNTVNAADLASFRQGLADAGYVEGRNVRLELRTTDQYERLPALAAELVRHPVDVIAAIGGPSASAAKAATATIPVVFSIGGDPVELGLVSSLNRPGANITGMTFFSAQLLQKQLGILHELIPNAPAFGMLINPHNARHQEDASDVRAAARVLGVQTHLASAGQEGELEAAFASLAKGNARAAIIAGDGFFLRARRDLAALAVRHAIPSIFASREFVGDGGLMSYGASVTEAYRHAGVYTGRILKGERPGDLPILQPSRFEFLINLKTAKALGLEVPAQLLARADEVIE